MPLSGSNMGGTLETGFTGLTWNGPDMPDFADAIGQGTVLNLIGVAFATQDVGATAGSGVGTGTGVVGIIPATLSTALFGSFVSAFGQAGPDLPDMCDQLALALQSELALATLTSTHSPVFAGTGTIVVGSIAVVGTAMGTSIFANGTSYGFVGINWVDVADVIGTEYANHILANGTGEVTITGSGAPGSPGAGVGSGVLS